MFEDFPDVVSIDDVMNMLKIGKNYVYKLLKDNEIKTIRIGKKYIIPKQAVINYVINAIGA